MRDLIKGLKGKHTGKIRNKKILKGSKKLRKMLNEKNEKTNEQKEKKN